MVVLLALGTVAAVLASRTHPSPSPGTTTTQSTTTTAAASGPPFAVGSLSLTLREPVGSTVRVLPTTVYYPATGAAGGAPAAGATPQRGAGPYPLVVFSEGYDIAPQAYGALLDAWAAAGYVVAAPVYPLTDPAEPGGVNESDIVNHPADLRYVISALVGLTQASGGDLAGLIRPNAIAVIGHSDGGDVSLATVANTCCTDPRISAAILLSGAELTSFGGQYFAGTTAVPLLVVQGTADTINPPECSVQIYDAAPSPKHYLSLFGESHTGAYLPAGPARAVVERVTIDFLDAYLKGSRAALARMARDGTVPGLAGMTSAPTVTAHLVPLGGTCPGAPPG